MQNNNFKRNFKYLLNIKYSDNLYLSPDNINTYHMILLTCREVPYYVQGQPYTCIFNFNSELGFAMLELCIIPMAVYNVLYYYYTVIKFVNKSFIFIFLPFDVATFSLMTIQLS